MQQITTHVPPSQGNKSQCPEGDQTPRQPPKGGMSHSGLAAGPPAVCQPTVKLSPDVTLAGNTQPPPYQPVLGIGGRGQGLVFSLAGVDQLAR